MKIEVKRDELVKGLEYTARIAVRNHTLPVLQCVRLEAKGKELILGATNLEISITVRTDANVIDEGIVAVPATLLQNSITLSGTATIGIEVVDDVCLITAGKSKTKIKTIAADEFPVSTPPSGASQEVDGKLLGIGIKTAAFAASQSSIKPELGCVYIHQKQTNTLTFVATDSFRLAEKTVSQTSFTLENPLLIPQKNALELARIIDLETENPKIIISPNQLSLIFPRVTLTTRLVEGNFPDYAQIIPKEYETHATVLTKDFAIALKKTNIFTNKFLQVAVTVDAKGRALVLASENTDAGTTRESIDAAIEGGELTLNFNQHYLADPLGYISDESTILHFGGAGRPMVLNGIHDQNFRYLVMPMNR